MQRGADDSSPSKSARRSILGDFASLFSVPLPDWFPSEVFLGLALAGLLAFAGAGFLGYGYMHGLANSHFFVRPTALFIFFCLLILTVQLSMVFHPAPRAELDGGKRNRGGRASSPEHLFPALLAPLTAIAVVALYDLDRQQLLDVLNNVATFIFGNPNTPRLIANFINFWFIVVFAADSLLRWTRSTQGLIRAWPERTHREQWMERLLGVIANDLIAGSVLFALLSVLFRSDVVNLLGRLRYAVALPLATPVSSGPCPVSFIFAECKERVGPGDPTTITHVDALAAVFAIGTGLIVLFFYLVLRALHRRITVLQIIFDTLRQARNVQRVLSAALEGLLTPVRRAAWPALVFVGVFAVAAAADNVQQYLHLLSYQHQCWYYGRSAATGQNCAGAFIDTGDVIYADLLNAIGQGGIAALAIIFSGVLQLYELRSLDQSLVNVAGYWIPALGKIGLSMVPAFFVVSLGFCAINFGIVLTVTAPAGTIPMSFAPPGTLTYVSFVIMALIAGIGYARSRSDYGGAS